MDKYGYLTEKMYLLPNAIGVEIEKVIGEQSKNLQLEIKEEDKNFLQKLNDNFKIFHRIWLGFFIFGCLSVLSLLVVFRLGEIFIKKVSAQSRSCGKILF